MAEESRKETVSPFVSGRRGGPEAFLGVTQRFRSSVLSQAARAVGGDFENYEGEATGTYRR